MKYYKKLISAFAAVTCLATATNAALADEQTADLTLKYQPGKVYYTTQSTAMLVDVAPGTQVKNHMVLSMTGAASVHKKGVGVQISYEGLKMHIKMGDDIVADYDSSKEDNDPQFADQIEPMLETKFLAIFDKKGNYVGSEGLDKLKLEPSSGITKESLEAMMKLGSEMLPNREVKVGESWKAEMKVPMQGMGKMKMIFNEKLVSIDTMNGRNLAKIGFTAQIKPIEVKQNGTVVKIASKSITGTILFDLDLHQVYKTEMDMKLNMEARGQNMSMSAMTKQELTKVEAAK